MAELYTLSVTAGGVAFAPREDEALQNMLEEEAINGYSMQELLGDDELLSCVVMRKEEGPGGLFIVQDDMDMLLCAVAESNLAYVEGINHFAEIVSQARYALDISESKNDEEDE